MWFAWTGKTSSVKVSAPPSAWLSWVRFTQPCDMAFENVFSCFWVVQQPSIVPRLPVPWVTERKPHLPQNCSSQVPQLVPLSFSGSSCSIEFNGFEWQWDQATFLCRSNVIKCAGECVLNTCKGSHCKTIYSKNHYHCVTSA